MDYTMLSHSASVIQADILLDIIQLDFYLVDLILVLLHNF